MSIQLATKGVDLPMDLSISKIDQKVIINCWNPELKQHQWTCKFSTHFLLEFFFSLLSVFFSPNSLFVLEYWNNYCFLHDQWEMILWYVRQWRYTCSQLDNTIGQLKNTEVNTRSLEKHFFFFLFRPSSNILLLINLELLFYYSVLLKCFNLAHC